MYYECKLILKNRQYTEDSRKNDLLIKMKLVQQKVNGGQT